MSGFNGVSIELAVRILSGLSIEDLINVRTVCNEWFEIIKVYKLIRSKFNKNQFTKKRLFYVILVSMNTVFDLVDLIISMQPCVFTMNTLISTKSQTNDKYFLCSL